MRSVLPRRGRRRFLQGGLALAGLGLLSGCGLPLPQGQPPATAHRIGYLSSVDRATELPRSGALRQALRELGYVEGQNITVEYRYADGSRDRASALAAELVRLEAEVIVAAGGDSVIRAAMQATRTIPIVLGGSGAELVAAGYVESLARPGGNVTGVHYLGKALGGKRLELFKEAVPNLARVAALYDPGAPAAATDVRDLQVAARRSKAAGSSTTERMRTATGSWPGTWAGS
jgi:putative ABC transport system substrate-binding protein